MFFAFVSFLLMQGAATSALADSHCSVPTTAPPCRAGAIADLNACIYKQQYGDNEVNCYWNYELADDDKDGHCEWKLQENQPCYYDYANGTSACGTSSQLVYYNCLYVWEEED